MTFDEWWEVNNRDEHPYADRTEEEIVWNAAKADKPEGPRDGNSLERSGGQ